MPQQLEVIWDIEECDEYSQAYFGELIPNAVFPEIRVVKENATKEEADRSYVKIIKECKRVDNQFRDEILKIMFLIIRGDFKDKL